MRVAERQGLLTGRGLSPVQTMGVEILLQLEDQESARQEAEALKRTLAQIMPALIPKLFPDMFTEEKPQHKRIEEIETEEALGGAVLTGELEYDLEAPAPEEAQSIVERIFGSNANISTLTLKDLDKI